MSISKTTCLIVGSCAMVCLALVQAQQIYDADSSSELGKLVRGQGRGGQGRQFNSQMAGIQDQGAREFQGPAQPMQFAPTQHRRNFNGPSAGAGYGPSNLGAMASNGRPNSNSELSDDDEGSNFGPNFGANFDNSDNDESPANANQNADSAGQGLNQAASGYPGHSQADYNGNEGLNFDSQGSGFGPSSADGSDFGPSEGFNDGRRAKAASSPMGSSGFAGDEDAGAPQYGPNSAINADSDAEPEAGNQPRGQFGPNSASQADGDEGDDE